MSKKVAAILFTSVIIMFVIGFGISLFIDTAEGETDSAERFKKHYENVSDVDRLFYPVNMNES